jgi:hypothetical protein
LSKEGGVLENVGAKMPYSGISNRQNNGEEVIDYFLPCLTRIAGVESKDQLEQMMNDIMGNEEAELNADGNED